MENQKDIPSGKIKRSGIIGLTTARAGMKKIGHIAKQPFIPEEKKDDETNRNDEEIAELIFKSLSNLRGTALKAAQMISLEMELIPEAYRKELAKAASQVPPINRALIRKIVTTQFNAPPEKIFKTFESLPFAAASLGQVHRAISKDDEELAVKVQYPGIASCVKSDIDMLKLLVKPTKYYRIFRLCFNEIQEKIFEELDYFHEAENTVWFKENLKLEKISVPEVYPELSTENVLTTSMLEGKHLDEWLAADPSQEKRDYYGQLFVDLFKYASHDLKMIHADPNPGNYLFMDNGELGLIDFGCVKKLDDDFLNNIEIIYNDDYDNDMTRLKEIYQSIGIYYKNNTNSNRFKEFITSWIEWITRPRRREYFDFSKESEYFTEGLKHVKEFYSYINYFDGSFTYFGRTEYGLFRLLQAMGARVKMQFK